MKNLKRAFRRYKKDILYKKRLKNFSQSIDCLVGKDGKRVYNPTWMDFKEMNPLHKLKSMATMCSCPMCSCDKYNRMENKKEFKDILKSYE